MSDMDVREVDVATAFRRGDQRAFTQVFDDGFSRLYLFCFNLVRDDSEAEDIAIRAFSKVFDRHRHFTSMKAIRTYLYITARNSCYDHLKKLKRLSRRQQQYLSLVQADPDMEFVKMDVDLMEDLYKALNKLPETSKQVLEMIYLEGKKYQDVANELQISEEAVGNRRFYAIKKLKELLADNPALLVWAFEMVFLNRR
jgi:RNA polymerase sigma-70 factor (ECF subfamily)